MAVRDRDFPRVVEILDHNNDITPPFAAIRKNHPDSDYLQQTVGVECAMARFVENGEGTYVFDVLIPANAVILDVIVAAEALWAAGTSASLEVGLFSSADPPVADDADGFYTAVDLKATDLLATESLSLSHSGGVGGSYLVGTATHWEMRTSATDRLLRFSVVSSGAGTTGRTFVAVVFAHAGEHLTVVTQ